MPFRFRKSKKLGPLRFTLSRSGWSASVGGRALRVTRRSDRRLQTTIGTPIPGLRFQRVHGRRAGPHRGRRVISAAVLVAAGAVPLVRWGVPLDFALPLSAGLLALAGWGVAWWRIAWRRRRARRRPVPRPWASPRRAEAAARDWMRYLGFPDARMTNPGADGGLDVVAARAVAQVKATHQPTGRPVVQQTYGAATGRQAAVFSLGGFTDQASAWATAQGVALFHLDRSGRARPANRVAADWLRRADRRWGTSPEAGTGRS